MAERVDGQVDFRAFLALGAIVGGLRAALGRRTQGPTVEGCTRFRQTSGGQAQQGAQVVGQRIEAAGCQPALSLLVDGLPGRKVVGHQAPRRARLHHVAQAVEHRAQAMLALPGVLAQQRQVMGDQRPILIGAVERVGLA